MLRGRPTTTPTIPRPAAISASRAASFANFALGTASSAVAVMRSPSLTATPIRFVPGSRPISGPGRSASAVTSSWTRPLIRARAP